MRKTNIIRCLSVVIILIIHIFINMQGHYISYAAEQNNSAQIKGKIEVEYKADIEGIGSGIEEEYSHKYDRRKHVDIRLSSRPEALPGRLRGALRCCPFKFHDYDAPGVVLV